MFRLDSSGHNPTDKGWDVSALEHVWVIFDPVTIFKFHGIGSDNCKGKWNCKR